MSQEQSTSDFLKVAFPSKQSISEYEPTRIHLDYEYILLETIYSPLIDLSDDKGAPIASIAKEHFWRGNDLHLVIRENLKTIEGYKITVDDVIFSLKRVLVLSENTHGDFKSLVCPNIHLKTVEDHCPGIIKSGNTLILKLAAKRDFLLTMLASIDFAIIPKIAVEPYSLKIKDYKNTSGPYFVKEDLGGGEILLEVNPQHYLYSNKMATQIKLSPTKGFKKNKIVDLFKKRELDLVTTIEGLNVEDFKELDRGQVNFHETIHIKTKVAFVTEKGMQRFDANQRLAFAKALQSSFHTHFKNKEPYKPATQFFLPFSEGGFSKDDDQKLLKTMAGIEAEASGEGMHLAVYSFHQSQVDEYSQILKKQMPELRVDKANGIPAFTQLSDKDMPDFIIVSTDSGFLENISLLSYSMAAGIFGFSKEDGKTWLKNYMNTEKREERLENLKKMHLESLTEGRMIPLVSTPYVAIANKPWVPQLSELFANCPLWKIRKN